MGCVDLTSMGLRGAEGDANFLEGEGRRELGAFSDGSVVVRSWFSSGSVTVTKSLRFLAEVVPAAEAVALSFCTRST